MPFMISLPRPKAFHFDMEIFLHVSFQGKFRRHKRVTEEILIIPSEFILINFLASSQIQIPKVARKTRRRKLITFKSD